MKKLLALSLILALLVSVTACGDSEPTEATTEPTTETTTAAPTETTTAAPTETTEAPTETTTAAPTETTEAPTETTETPTEGEDAPELSVEGVLGTQNGYRYENSSLGISCDLDENWYIFSEAELATLVGLTADTINDEAISNLLENSGAAYLFYAQQIDPSSTKNINIVLENTGLMGMLLTEDSYIDLSMTNLKTALEASGITELVIEKVKVQFAGEEHSSISISGKIGDQALYEQVIPLVFKDRVACITIATFGTDGRADVMASFSPLPV